MESVSAGTKYLGIYGISCLYIRRVQGLISALEMIPSTSTALWGLYPCQKDVTEQLNSFRMKPQSPSFSTEVKSLKLWLEVFGVFLVLDTLIILSNACKCYETLMSTVQARLINQ